MKYQKSVCVLWLLSFSMGAWAQVSTPAWFDSKARTKLVQSQAQKDGVTGKLDLQKFETRKIEMGAQKLNLVIARFGSGSVEDENGYNLSEIYTDSPNSPKLLFQLVDKTTCDSKVVEDATIKKLGFVNELQVHFAQVQLKQPTCPNSLTNPKIFLVFQENKKAIEKVYQSEVSENGRYRIAFQKDIIRLEYAKNLNSESQAIQLVWNAKTQKFEEAKP